MTPSEFLIDVMEKVDLEDADTILIVIRCKDRGIRVATNTQSRLDAYSLGSIAVAYTQADIVRDEVSSLFP